MNTTEDWEKVLRALEVLPAPCTLEALIELLVTRHGWSSAGALITVRGFRADGSLIISDDEMVHRPPTAPLSPDLGSAEEGGWAP